MITEKQQLKLNKEFDSRKEKVLNGYPFMIDQCLCVVKSWEGDMAYIEAHKSSGVIITKKHGWVNKSEIKAEYPLRLKRWYEFINLFKI